MMYTDVYVCENCNIILSEEELELNDNEDELCLYCGSESVYFIDFEAEREISKWVRWLV